MVRSEIGGPGGTSVAPDAAHAGIEKTIVVKTIIGVAAVVKAARDPIGF
jgi:hypothetical protein